MEIGVGKTIIKYWRVDNINLEGFCTQVIWTKRQCIIWEGLCREDIVDFSNRGLGPVSKTGKLTFIGILQVSNTMFKISIYHLSLLMSI